ncbi:MAG: LacI family DNA-binding transcriptional regulator [Alkalispirochaeta sp.]
MRGRRTTLKDIASTVGVSPRAVSSALNNSGRLSPATRERILRVAKEMNYQPNVLARGLVQRRTYLLGALFPYASVSFFNQIISGIEAECSRFGYDLLLGNASLLDEREEPQALLRLMNRNVDGILCSPDPRARALFRQFVGGSVPVIQLMTRVPDIDLPFVGVDNERGGYVATQHLLSLGHRNIGFLASDRSWYTEIQDRQAGYVRALLEAGVQLDLNRFQIPGALTVADGMRATAALLESAPGLTAIFAPTDHAAIGAIHACRAAHRRVPEEISVVGYDDLEIAELQIDYPLTTVAQPKERIGTLAFELFQSAVSGASPTTVLLEPHLVIRSTTAPVRSARRSG